MPDDSDGCAPVLPADPCAAGTMAVPGDASCHEMAPCGDAKYGDAPLDATTEFVDVAYQGADSDGSEAKPWTAVQKAIDAAADGAVIAIAAGKYAGNIWTNGKSVRIWGRCPAMVELHGTDAMAPSVQLAEGGAPELHAVAVTGPFVGVFGSQVAPALIDRVWVHDVGFYGVVCSNQFGATSCTVRASLVENATGLGVGASAADVTIEKSAVRGTVEDTTAAGTGVLVESGGSLHVTGSVVSSNVAYGLRATGASAIVEGSVLADTRPSSTNGRTGVGAGAIAPDPNHRATLTVRGSLVRAQPEFGLLASTSDLVVEGTVIRDLSATPAKWDDTHPSGTGIVAADGATVSVSASLLDRCLDAGFAIRGSTATLEGVAIRDTALNAIVVYDQGHVDVHTAIFDASSAAAVYVSGASANLDSVIVRNTKPSPINGLFGDGITVESFPDLATASLSHVRLEASARAAVSNFAGTVHIGQTVLECNPIQMDGEVDSNRSFTFDQTGSISCGCKGASTTCRVESAMLEPPTIPGS